MNTDKTNMTDWDLYKENIKQAEESVRWKSNFNHLNTCEIDALKIKAKTLGLTDEIIEKTDRLMLIKCIFYHCENASGWQKQYQELRDKVKNDRG